MVKDIEYKVESVYRRLKIDLEQPIVLVYNGGS